MVLNAESSKPEETQLIQDPTFVRDTVWHHPIEGADAIGADDQKAIP
jgi:hypothetical protein